LIYNHRFIASAAGLAHATTVQHPTFIKTFSSALTVWYYRFYNENYILRYTKAVTHKKEPEVLNHNIVYEGITIFKLQVKTWWRTTATRCKHVQKNY
jgi:hypothetical protein